MDPPVVCEWCCEQPHKYLCGGCLQVSYCNESCQGADWDFHQAPCEARIVDESQYTLLKAKVEAQIKWWNKVKRRPVPFPILAQQHTIGVLEANVKKVQENAKQWAKAWPPIDIKGEGVEVVRRAPTAYRRGKPATKAFSEITKHQLVRVGDLWYPLLIAHSTRDNIVQVDGQIERLFKAVAPLNAYNQRLAQEAATMWQTHTTLVDETKDTPIKTYYKNAVKTIQQSKTMGETMQRMITRK